MRISDWSSDLCSSDLPDPGCDEHRSGSRADRRLQCVRPCARASPVQPGIGRDGRFTNSSQRIGYDDATVKGISLTGEYAFATDWNFKSITAYRKSDVAFSA